MVLEASVVIRLYVTLLEKLGGAIEALNETAEYIDGLGRYHVEYRFGWLDKLSWKIFHHELHVRTRFQEWR